MSYYLRNKARHDAATKKNYQEVRRQVLDAYGGKCNCCGEGTPEFLGVDHVFGGGGAQRKALGLTGYTLYRWLRRNGFPKDEFQLLCHNCNQAKGYYRECPHERERRLREADRAGVSA